MGEKPKIAFVVGRATSGGGLYGRFRPQILLLSSYFEVHVVCLSDWNAGPLVAGVRGAIAHPASSWFPGRRGVPGEAGSMLGQLMEQEGIGSVWAAGYYAGRACRDVRAGFKVLDFIDSNRLHLRSSALAALARMDAAGALLGLARCAALHNAHKNLAGRFNAVAYCCRRDGLASGFREDGFVILPTLVEPARLKKSRKESDAVMLGDWSYWANISALDYAVDKVLPLLRRKISLAIVGRKAGNATKDAASRAGKAGHEAIVSGWVDDLPAALRRSRLMLAPLEFGGGVPTKVLDSLMSVIPVVTTAFVKEGVDPDGRCPAIIACNNAREMADAVESLLADKRLAESLGAGGRRFMEIRHERAVAAHKELIARILQAQRAL
ncbi:MAG: glycosyltransferase family 4 protein [Candidatus Micrarchaeota archaeon]